MPVASFNRAASLLLLVNGCLCALMAVAALATSLWTPFLLSSPFFLMQVVAGAWYRRKIGPQLRVLRSCSDELAIIKLGLQWFANQDFATPPLRDMIQETCSSRAPSLVKRLQRLAEAAGQLQKTVFVLAGWLLAADVQLAFAAERWRSKKQVTLEQALSIWAEFDALQAISCYAYEHPEHVFPELCDGEVVYEAEELGHPLLLAKSRVGNSVKLDAGSRLYVMSGSNMAGKSTLLRALGLNAVLAAAGAPVCATSARISMFAVCASISIVDSLLDGRSKFLAEIERLRAAIHYASGKRTVLFLVDEILSGTNSRDRCIVAKAIVRELISNGAVGALSTHDLALTEIVMDKALRGRNVCMESKSASDPLEFDYKLRPGVAQRSNGRAIVEMVGIKTQST